MAMARIVETAHAKVNLTLSVRGRRPDGYHDIASLIVFADVGDELTLTTDRPGGLEVAGRFAPALTGENLIARAAAALRARCPDLPMGAVLLDKRLPVAAGLGGGSADAAAFLRAVRRAQPDLTGTVDWQAVASALGADVAVCLSSGPSFVTGIGDQVSPAPPLPDMAAVLACPAVPLDPSKTATVYRALAAPPLDPARPPSARTGPLRSLDAVVALLEAEPNDLRAAALSVMPVIAETEAALAASRGCRAVRLSGSGPTCFGLYDDAMAAQAAAQAIARAYPTWWVVACTLRGLAISSSG
ncbi:MAG: 4-(cytidine 5'-diphospho)-2-C-methyl-D-erythritol kinase [Hyphomicrobiaceae bacterium]